jgi:hypothetical protein
VRKIRKLKEQELKRVNLNIPLENDLTLDFGKPEFDLIQPRGIREREAEIDEGQLVIVNLLGWCETMRSLRSL